MDFVELLRRWKRALDSYVSYRRLWLIIIITFCVSLYLCPTVFYWFSQSPKQYQDIIDRCIEDRLTPFHIETLEFNANVRLVSNNDEPDKSSYLPFIGNGMIGLVINPESPIYIKTSRTLSLPVNWHPLLTLETGENSREAIVTSYVNGMSTRHQCFQNGLHATYRYYAHRTIPQLFVQEIEIVNPTPRSVRATLAQPKKSSWPTASTQTVRVQQERSSSVEYHVVTGIVDDANYKPDKVIAVSISTKVLPNAFKIEPRETIIHQVLTVVTTKVLGKWEYFEQKDEISKENIELLKKVSGMKSSELKQEHVDVWNKLWNTGLSISMSKAAGAVNGDKINATVYYVLSNVRSFLHEPNLSHDHTTQIASQLENVEGCYGGHHTFNALNLWGSLLTFNDVTSIVSYWLLTLEKQGCHKLISAGADGVIQAMILSIGGFRFSAHHLEFNIHPRFLHRDYFFRRINYGSQTHINVSVTLQENNKAILGVSLDKSDKVYYACDGGCIDDPVQLGSFVSYFPVKLTEPVTAILFVTSDKRHMELIKHTLHVKEINEAPAHEHHVIALHRHGHHLGGLPTLFWASVSFLIIIFHLFLFKLIYNEYCGKQDKYRTRYGKL